MSEQKTEKDGGSIALIALVVLAIIASVVMLIAGSTAALKIALLASLWAAVLGFFLVSRYRRQAEMAAEQLAMQDELHKAELAKRQPSEEEMSMLAEIQEEIATIRTQLEELSGREYTYEPAALHAEARRIMELEARTMGSPYEESEVVTQSSSGAPSADAIAGRVGSQPSHSHPNPLSDLLSERAAEKKESPASTFDTGTFQAVKWDGGGSSEYVGRRRKPEPEPEQEQGQHGRRRSDDHHEGAVSVADLMAQMKKGKK